MSIKHWSSAGILLRLAAIILCILLGLLLPGAAGAAQVEATLRYPEGAIWIDDRLFLAEMGADQVLALREGRLVPFWRERGCGPTSIAPFGRGDLLVLCHLAASLVHIDKAGRTLARFDRDGEGRRLRDPNDSFSDSQGGAFFTDPGLFSRLAAADGAVLHIDAAGRIRRLAQGLAYPNGVTFDATRRRLTVSEHLGGRLLQWTFGRDGTSLEALPPINLAARTAPRPRAIAESGPDGIEMDAEGRLWICQYGEGRIVVLDPDGRYLGSLDLGYPFVTNIAISATGRVAIVGTADMDFTKPAGRLELFDQDELLGKLR